MDLIKNWKLHLLALIVVIVAESIGMHRFGLVVLLPLLYALVLGGILSFPKFGILKFSEMDRAAKFMPIAMLVLLTKIGLGIGPNPRDAPQFRLGPDHAGVRPLLRHADLRPARCASPRHEARGHRRVLLDRPRAQRRHHRREVRP